MKIGYIRASRNDHFYIEQHTALENEGCERIFEDFDDRLLELEHMLDYVRSDDKVYLYQMDRLGLSIKDLMKFVHDLLQKNIHLKSVQDGIDTSTQEGKIFLKIFNALGLCEQNAIGGEMLHKAPTESAPSATHNIVKPFILRNDSETGGRVTGRPKGLSHQAKEKAESAASLYQEGTLSMREIANKLNISTATLYSYLRYEKVI